MNIFWPPGTYAWVEVSGQVPKQVVCEKCGKEYVYV